MKKLIKRTKKNDEGFALAYQITEKLIRRGGNLLYNEPIPSKIDTLAGSSVQPRALFQIDRANSVLGISKLSDEGANKTSAAKQRLNHLKQGKSKIVQVEIGAEDTMQLHEAGRKIRQNKMNEQK